MKVLKNFYVQIITIIIWGNNQLSSFWGHRNDLTTSWGGFIGYPSWYNSWVVYDVEIGKLLIWMIVLLLIIFPLKGDYRTYAIGSVCTLILIMFLEFFIFLFYGNNSKNEDMFYVFFSSYILSIVVMYFLNNIYKKNLC
jgi:hypothetical protein